VNVQRLRPNVRQQGQYGAERVVEDYKQVKSVRLKTIFKKSTTFEFIV